MSKPDPLSDEPFSYRSRADGSIEISHRARPVTILRDAAAERFAARMLDADAAAAAQQLMARVTGNFKRGNERNAKRRP